MIHPNFTVLSGIPITLEILDLNADTPINLQIEKPPRFTTSFLSLNTNPFETTSQNIIATLSVAWEHQNQTV
jgi:hypothetical protein